MVFSARAVLKGCLSFAKTCAMLLLVTIATSRELIAPMITMIVRPERSDVTRVPGARQQL
jgi:hypothetical protein